MKTTPPITYISIIEDNTFFRAGWEALLGNYPEFHLVGAFQSCEDAFAGTAIGESDVVLMDIALPGMTGIEGTAHIRNAHPTTSVIMCSVYEDDQNVFDAICAGAIGYLLKRSSSDEIVAAIRIARAGGSPMTPTIARKVLRSFQKPLDAKGKDIGDDLTRRETDVLERMSLGKSYALIADELELSIDGVRFHIRNIYEKLQVHSRSAAIAKGLKQRIIQPPR